MISQLFHLQSLTGKHVADGMYSNDEEYIEFIEPVFLEGQVEHWLCDLGESVSSTTFLENQL